MSGRKHFSKTYRSSSDEEEEEVNDVKFKRNRKTSLRSSQEDNYVCGNNAVEQTRRRGRGPSKRPCLNRNALMARENRLRKKAYVEKIENTLSYYQQENKNLACTIQKQGIDIKRLTGEVAYLKNVLRNNSAITALLKTINDGLKKFNTHTKKSTVPNNMMRESLKIGDTEDEKLKCSCLFNVKQNMSDSKRCNIFDSMSNGYLQTKQDNPQQDHNGTQEKNSISYESTKKPINNKSTMRVPISNTDHTYTVSKEVAFDVNHGMDNNHLKNNMDAISLSSMYQTTSNADSKYVQETNSILPVTSATTCNSEGTNDTNITDMDLNELSLFNGNIFDDLPKCDDIMSSIDLEVSNSCTEEDLFQSLNNTGICLHVNSDKVSLEYCAICHMNSTNNEIV